MKSNLSHTPLAVLNASLAESVGIAALSFDTGVEQNGWCQLLPAGHFTAVDGRPHDVVGGQWFIDRDIAERLIGTALAATNDLVIDYEHQTLNADNNGQPAPAAGWFKQIEWREDSGLWIKPSWTARARDFIDNGEYRFLSAVFPYDKKTGAPLALHSAALVNRPGVDGLAATALSAKHFFQSSTEDTPMNETLLKLLTKLGIEVSADADLTDAQSTAALSALDLLQVQAGKVVGLESNIASLKAATSEVDLSQYVPVVTYNALVTDMAALKADGDKNSAKTLIDEAQAVGKVMAAEVGYLTDLAQQQGIAVLKSMLDGRPAIAALSAQQTTEIVPPDNKGNAALSADEKEAARLLGQTEEEFAALKAQ